MGGHYTGLHEWQITGLREECGVFGVYLSDCEADVSPMIYYGLYALQHRGQESAGIAVADGLRLRYFKDMGLVSEVFDPKILSQLKGYAGIGHVRYSTTGSSYVANAQPLVVRYKGGDMALAHNGNLVNAVSLRAELEAQGAVFQTTSDTEVIANLISRAEGDDIKDVISQAMRQINGSYAVVILTADAVIGVRDPYGIRPLCLGKLGDGYVLASESCALDAIGAEFVRDIKPGEGIAVSKNGVESFKIMDSPKMALCSFEFVYLARTDSVIDGASVYRARINAGRMLAMEHPVQADMVIGVPDSGTTAAIGYAQQSGIPFGEGLIKNRYVGRTFIQPEQKMREEGVKVKLNALRETVKGKRIVMVDDSIVRGTTSRQIVDMLKDAGATEVHMRISSPPVQYPCYFGIDTPSREHLIGATHSVKEISEIIGVDSLGYLSLDGLVRSIAETVGSDEFDALSNPYCMACFDGRYPMEVSCERQKAFSKGTRR